MSIACIVANSFENRCLEYEIGQRMSCHNREEEDDGTSVEGNDVAKRHDGEAFLAELLAHRVVKGKLLKQGPQLLELWRLLFLRTSVASIEEEIEPIKHTWPLPKRIKNFFALGPKNLSDKEIDRHKGI